MTNGLTKRPQTVVTPGVVGRPAIEAIASQWYLVPSPPGYYYAFSNAEWILRSTSTSTPSTPSYSISVPPGGGYGYSYPAGSRVVFGYAQTYGSSPTVFIDTTASSSGNSPPPTPPAGFVLVRIDVYTASPAPPPGGVAPLPAGVQPIRLLASSTLSNGYPSVAEAVVQGRFSIPSVDGGTFTVTRNYRKLSTGAYVWDGSGDPDPPYFVTGSAGLRTGRILNFPGAPAVPSTPPTVEYKTWQAWNAGANSIAELDGNVFVQLAGPEAAGAYVGFFEGGSRAPEDYNGLVAAFRFTQTPTGRQWTIKDGSRSLSVTNTPYTTADVFRIERVNGVMVFRLNGTEVYRSARISSGPLRVGTSLYASGDKVL